MNSAHPATIVPAKEAILSDAAAALYKLRTIIVTHEDAFAAATLEPRLQIGLQCLKAHQVFAHNPGKGGNKKGKNQHSGGTVTRDGSTPEGFEGWLERAVPWLKKSTSYKYMAAVRGLGLDHDASEKQVAAALRLRLSKGSLTIKALCDAALEAIAPPPPEPPKLEQQEFNFLKQSLTAFREETEALINIKDRLDAYPDFKRAAVARLYGALHDLTGTHWKPSDEPDDLALVDPDAISL